MLPPTPIALTPITISGAPDDNERTNLEAPCLTLKKLREELSIPQPRLAAACFIASLKDELGETLTEDLIKKIFRGDIGRCVDTVQLYKFENGHKRPWASAAKNLVYVLSVAHERNISLQELFPELFINGASKWRS